jgi:hypothetical protein
MKVSGFTFIKNAVKYDYPIVEAILSVLPLCDEFVLALGDSDDDTAKLIQTINSPKLKIIHTTWDATMKKGGGVLADETNKALAAVSKESTWCIYIQGDECVHEQDLEAIRQSMWQWKDDLKVEGLVFDYLHFYCTYDYISDPFSRYHSEVRIIRNNLGIKSWKDAQGFRKAGEKLYTKLANAKVYHYGWVKAPHDMQKKQKYFNTLWHDEHKATEMVTEGETYNYETTDRLYKFMGSHPKLMQQRIDKLNWKLNTDPTTNPLKWKIRLKMWLKLLTGRELGVYKNYRMLK